MILYNCCKLFVLKSCVAGDWGLADPCSRSFTWLLSGSFFIIISMQAFLKQLHISSLDQAESVGIDLRESDVICACLLDRKMYTHACI